MMSRKTIVIFQLNAAAEQANMCGTEVNAYVCLDKPLERISISLPRHFVGGRAID